MAWGSEKRGGAAPRTLSVGSCRCGGVDCMDDVDCMDIVNGACGILWCREGGRSWRASGGEQRSPIRYSSILRGTETGLSDGTAIQS